MNISPTYTTRTNDLLTPLRQSVLSTEKGIARGADELGVATVTLDATEVDTMELADLARYSEHADLLTPLDASRLNLGFESLVRRGRSKTLLKSSLAVAAFGSLVATVPPLALVGVPLLAAGLIGAAAGGVGLSQEAQDLERTFGGVVEAETETCRMMAEMSQRAESIHESSQEGQVRRGLLAKGRSEMVTRTGRRGCTLGDVYDGTEGWMLSPPLDVFKH